MRRPRELSWVYKAAFTVASGVILWMDSTVLRSEWDQRDTWYNPNDGPSKVYRDIVGSVRRYCGRAVMRGIVAVEAAIPMLFGEPELLATARYVMATCFLTSLLGTLAYAEYWTRVRVGMTRLTVVSHPLAYVGALAMLVALEDVLYNRLRHSFAWWKRAYIVPLVCACGLVCPSIT